MKRRKMMPTCKHKSKSFMNLFHYKFLCSLQGFCIQKQGESEVCLEAVYGISHTTKNVHQFHHNSKIPPPLFQHIKHLHFTVHHQILKQPQF